jgi:hypothetical protein
VLLTMSVTLLGLGAIVVLSAAAALFLFGRSKD